MTCRIRGRPQHYWTLKSGDYNTGVDAIQVMTMKVSKGLEFPVVALPGVGHMPAPGEDEKEAARVFYVAVTRATQRLVMGTGEDGEFGRRLELYRYNTQLLLIRIPRVDILALTPAVENLYSLQDFVKFPTIFN